MKRACIECGKPITNYKPNSRCMGCYRKILDEQIKYSHARMFEALELRKQGLTYKAIGKHFGVSGNRAMGMVFKAERLAQRTK